MNTLTKITAALLVAGSLTACLFEEKESYEKTPPGPYVIAITSAGDAGTDYFMTAKTLDSGTISPRGRGIEQTGWRYTGTTHGMFLSVGYWNDHNFIVYHKDPADSTKIVEKGRFVFPATIDIMGEVSASEMLAIEIPRAGFIPRKLLRINLTAGSIGITSSAVTHIYVDSVADSLTAQPTGIVHRGDKVFVPFYKIHARGDFSTPQTDSSHVAVYNYPAMTLDKVIKSPTGGALGMYGNSNGLIKTASGDLFGYSCASAACFTSDTSVGHSKIVRIPNGQTEFDAAWEWDFQQTTGKKLTWFAPIGGELAIARAMTPTPLELTGKLDTSVDWVALGFSFSQDLYVVDLAAKTATLVTGVPTHGGEYGTSVFVENGFAYMNILTANEQYLYKVNIAAKTGVRGAKISGTGIKLSAR